VAVTRRRLEQVGTAETRLRSLGYREFRVRHHGNCARVEVAPAELARAAAEWPRIADLLREAGFARVPLVQVSAGR
jgi:uncharacterized protein